MMKYAYDALWMVVLVASLSGCVDQGPFRGENTEGDSNAGPAVPELLASAQDGPIYLGANDEFVYWSEVEGGRVARVAKDGTGETLRVDAGGRPGQIEGDGGDVYWLTREGSIRGVRDTAFREAPGILADGVPMLAALSISAGHVFFTSFGVSDDPAQGSFRRVSRSGGGPEVLFSAELGALATVTSDTAVYWSTFNEVHRAPLDNASAKQTLAFEQGLVDYLAVAAGRVCWTSELVAQSSEYDIWCSNNSTNQRIATKQDSVLDIEITETHAYWTILTASGGAIVRHRFSDGATDHLIDGNTYPVDLDIQGAHLYWIERKSPQDLSGSIWRIAR